MGRPRCSVCGGLIGQDTDPDDELGEEWCQCEEFDYEEANDEVRYV